MCNVYGCGVWYGTFRIECLQPVFNSLAVNEMKWEKKRQQTHTHRNNTKIKLTHKFNFPLYFVLSPPHCSYQMNKTKRRRRAEKTRAPNIKEYFNMYIYKPISLHSAFLLFLLVLFHFFPRKVHRSFARFSLSLFIYLYSVEPPHGLLYIWMCVFLLRSFAISSVCRFWIFRFTIYTYSSWFSFAPFSHTDCFFQLVCLQYANRKITKHTHTRWFLSLSRSLIFAVQYARNCGMDFRYVSLPRAHIALHVRRANENCVWCIVLYSNIDIILLFHLFSVRFRTARELGTSVECVCTVLRKIYCSKAIYCAYCMANRKTLAKQQQSGKKDTK